MMRSTILVSSLSRELAPVAVFKSILKYDNHRLPSCGHDARCVQPNSRFTFHRFFAPCMRSSNG
uniref:Uncharacterized protein n=1 Tax=Anguilla anguilla TaxID=7936 RepID=A0A0E9SGP8_ANGAN